jgi:metal-responsive CopG/Arc/MetJ family transcriptional regulator
MIRVQSYFQKELIQELKMLSQLRGISLAEIIREAASSYVKKTADIHREKAGASTLLKSVPHLSFKGTKNLSSQMDKYIYGQ